MVCETETSFAANEWKWWTVMFFHYSFSAALVRRSCFILHTKLIWMVLHKFWIDLKKVFFSFFRVFFVFCLLFSQNTCRLLLPSCPIHEFCFKNACLSSDTWSIFVLFIKMYLLSFIHVQPLHAFWIFQVKNSLTVIKTWGKYRQNHLMRLNNN